MKFKNILFLSFLPLVLFLGCAEKTVRIVQYKEVNSTCPILKVNKIEIPKKENIKIKILKIKGETYIAIKKDKFLKLLQNYKITKKELNSTYNTIENFNNKVLILNKK